MTATLSEQEQTEVLVGAEKVFFEAMLDGYAGDKKQSSKTVDEDGYKTIIFASGNYKVVDRYCVTPVSDFSAGTTTIFWRPSEIHKFIPIWWMSYCGHYPKEVIPFLKDALRGAYEQQIFFGGRGPNQFFREGLFYINAAGETSNFRTFRGAERIQNGPTQMGYHVYFGMALI